MKIKSSILNFAFFILCISSGNNLLKAQENQSSGSDMKFTDRLFTGGNIGLQIGRQTMIDISPLFGYKITDNFVAGIGFTYQYWSYKDPYVSYHTDIYGGRFFSRYYFFKRFFIHGEYEFLNIETAFFDQGYKYHKSKRYWAGSVLGGIGYREQIGSKSYFNIMLLYNFNETPFGPYDSPIIYRAGIDIGL